MLTSLPGLVIALAAVAAPAPTKITARIDDDLTTIHLRVIATSTRSPTIIALNANRYREPPDLAAPADPVLLRQFYPRGFSSGAFEQVSIKINGVECIARPYLDGPSPWLRTCPGQGQVEIHAQLKLPRRTGLFGSFDGRITLAGGWFPKVLGASPIHELDVQHPPEFRLVGADLQKRTEAFVRRTVGDSFSLILRGPKTVTTVLADGSVELTHETMSAASVRRLEQAIQSGLAFWQSEGLAALKPRIHVIGVPMRRDLARAFSSSVLLSDRVFQTTPLERIERFHEIEFLRAFFATGLMQTYGFSNRSAKVLAAWLRDRYVETQFSRKDDAHEVIGFWRMLPVIDAMLVSPDLSFAPTYFRALSGPDLHYEDFSSPFVSRQNASLLYEKILDRLGKKNTADLLKKVLAGLSLKLMIDQKLGASFMKQWSGPYPKVQYRLGAIQEKTAGFEIEVIRDGDIISEPVVISVTDSSDTTTRYRVPASRARLRVLTASLSANVASIHLDPDGRLIETPSESQPSPRFDHRSPPRWNILLNNFSLLVSATDASFASAIDLGFYRRHDLRWRFALGAEVSPEAYRLGARARYGFGRRIHAGRLAQWLGGMFFSDHLRADFGSTPKASQGAGGILYYGFDNRRSYWAPGAGQGLRASMSFRRSLSGDQSGQHTLAMSLRGVSEWSLGASQILGIKAAAHFYAVGTPDSQLLFSLGGRHALRGFGIKDHFGRIRGLVSAQWQHPILRELRFNLAYLVWLNEIEGVFFADLAVLANDWDEVWGKLRWSDLGFADLGYGLRFYFDWLGVQPGLVTLDVGWPLRANAPKFWTNAPAVYLGFTQPFFSF
jgi:hypothetical protein